MTYGRVCRLWPVVVLIFSSCPRRPSRAGAACARVRVDRHSAVHRSGRPSGAGRGRARVRRQGHARHLGAAARPGGLAARADARRRRSGCGWGAAGRASTALLVCDAETAEAIETHRRRPLSGTVVSAGDKVWTVQPADGRRAPARLPFRAHDVPGGRRARRGLGVRRGRRRSRSRRAGWRTACWRRCRSRTPPPIRQDRRRNAEAPARCPASWSRRGPIWAC